MSRIVTHAFRFLTAPGLPGQILVACGSIGAVIIVSGIGLWGIIGACKVVMFLFHANN